MLLYQGRYRQRAPTSAAASSSRPTVFGDVTPEMTIAQEEIFGPVASLMRFDTDDQAVDDRQRHQLTG